MQDIKVWKTNIEDLIRKYQGKEKGVIGYWQADKFINELLMLLDKVQEEIIAFQTDDAFSMLFWLIKRLHKLYIDDSSTGCTGILYEEINNCLNQLCGCGTNIEKKILQKFKNFYANHDIDFFLLVDKFRSEKALEEEKQSLDDFENLEFLAFPSKNSKK